MYNQKIIDHAKQSATDLSKTAAKRALQKTTEATGDLIGKKIADKITKVSRSLPENSIGTVKSETGNIDLIEKYQ